MRTAGIFTILILTATSGFTQNFHLGIFGGMSHYQGDLVDGAFPINQAKGAIGFTGTYEVNDRWNLRAGITFAKVGGHDKYQKSEELKLRNLSFQSSVKELSVIGEYHIFNLYTRRITPYLFGGIGLYHFNPYTFDESGNQVYLKPLSTEGQGIAGYPKEYSLTQLSIPFGGGIKYAISDNVRIALEVGIRKTFTDYLDDVSGLYADPNDLLAARGTKAVELSYRADEVGGNPLYPEKGEIRGGAENKDYYYFSGIHITFRLPGSKGSRPGSKRANGCPVVQ